MAQVLIRNLEEQVVSRLKQRAENAGQSLEAFLRDTLTRAAAPNLEAAIAEVEALRERMRPGRAKAEDLVRAMRDERAAQQRKLHGLRE